MSKAKIIFIGITVVIISYFTLPWILISLGIMLSPSPPTPKNTYGEFPFHLVYEIDGEQFTVDDVLVCEFVGRGADEASGKYLKWDMRLLSGNQVDRFGGYSGVTGAPEWPTHAVVKLLGSVVVRNYMGSIYCDLGLPQYYLGYNVMDGYSPGRICNSSAKTIEANELWNQYKIRIIEANFSQPMVGNGIKIKK